MKIIDTKEALGNLEKGWAVTIGNFDGVHLGHREIIDRCAEACAEYDGRGVAVMTFEPHPVAILRPERAPGLLTPLGMKEHLLAEAGVDCMVVLRDSYELLNLSPVDFVEKFLMATAGPKVVVEGSNFNFGYGRSGDVRTLAELGGVHGFEVIEVQAKHVNLDDRRAVACSSSLVRQLLEKGEVFDAAKVLGKNYRLMGKITKGRGIGMEIGYPTANLEPMNQIIPDEGVYAGYVRVSDAAEGLYGCKEFRKGVFSIGRAKTFITDHPLLIEAHILDDGVGDIYGKYMAMDFVRKIRSQKRFENIEALKKQIAEDSQMAMGLLGK